MKPTQTSNRRNRSSGYSLIEVLIAVGVLGLTIASSLMAMRSGFSMVETARDNTLASQILQSEMENLRLRNWAYISQLETGPFQMESSFQQSPASGRFRCVRLVAAPNGLFREISLEVRWRSNNGVEMTRRYVTFFSKEGLNDYYYRSIQ